MKDRCIHCDRDVLIPDEYFGYLVQKPIVCEECWETNDEYDEMKQRYYKDMLHRRDPEDDFLVCELVVP